MSLQHHLRQRNHRQAALEQLRNQYAGSEITDVLPEARYLRLLLHDTAGNQRRAWLNIDVWLQSVDAHLPGIPWQEVPLSYLTRWLNNLQFSFLLQEHIWEVAHIALPEENLPEKWLSLPTEPCPLLCLAWPDTTNNTESTQIITASRVPFRLRYVLGFSQLPLSQLAGLAPGDLLLIRREFTHLAIEDQRLFRFSYHKNQEVIVEERLTEHHEEAWEEEVLNEWADLPVGIEFVLDSQTVTLAELDVITPGMALPLKPEAEQKIKIYLNKKLFARGELVALENGSLAVEINQVNPVPVVETEYPDA